MYKLIEEDEIVISVTRLSDKSCIPLDIGNRDYQEYLTWVAEGNTAEPADTE